tara:strand:+ start:1365 stop:1820 length:456 start_codon:yes stop_codon:yes gene_type:complete
MEIDCMIQRIAAITSALGVATIAITSIVDFLNAIEKHRMRNHSTEYQKQHRSEHDGRAELLMKPVDSTNIGRTEGSFPKKTGYCRICDHKGYTEWHHIISQHHARKTRQFPLLRNPGNIVELCKTCHNQTSASKSRYLHEKKKEKKTNRFW